MNITLILKNSSGNIKYMNNFLSTKIAKIAMIIASSKTQLKNVLLQATKEDKAITFNYTSIINNQTKQYTVMPLEIKNRILKNGNNLVLYGEDVNDGNRTKSFVINNIDNIKINNKRFHRKRKNKLENLIKN